MENSTNVKLVFTKINQCSTTVSTEPKNIVNESRETYLLRKTE